MLNTNIMVIDRLFPHLPVSHTNWQGLGIAGSHPRSFCQKRLAFATARLHRSIMVASRFVMIVKTTLPCRSFLAKAIATALWLPHSQQKLPHHALSIPVCGVLRRSYRCRFPQTHLKFCKLNLSLFRCAADECCINKRVRFW